MKSKKIAYAAKASRYISMTAFLVMASSANVSMADLDCSISGTIPSNGPDATLTAENCDVAMNIVGGIPTPGPHENVSILTSPADIINESNFFGFENKASGTVLNGVEFVPGVDSGSFTNNRNGINEGMWINKASSFTNNDEFENAPGGIFNNMTNPNTDVGTNFTNNGFFNNGGTFNNDPGSTVSNTASGAFDNEGTVNNEGTFTNDGNVNNVPGAVFDNTDGTVDNNNSFNNEGSTYGGDDSTFEGDMDVFGDGQIGIDDDTSDPGYDGEEMTFNDGTVTINSGIIHLDLKSATEYDQILGNAVWDLEKAELHLDFEILPFADILDLVFDGDYEGYLLPLITGLAIHGDFSAIVHNFFDNMYDISFVETTDEQSETFNALFTQKAQVSEPAAAFFIFMGLLSLAYARRRK